jgi:hypothetical protein
MIARYSHLNPQVNTATLESILSYKPKYFHWAGSDLFNAVNHNGRRQMIVGGLLIGHFLP